MRVVVVTVVHHPLDARIWHREIAALLAAGHEVTYVAPWSATGVMPPAGVRAVDVPRSSGRHRLRAVVAARRAIRRERGDADLALIHDPELLVAVAWLRRPVTVWDVHEDTAAALVDKTWVPSLLRAVLARSIRAVELLAERHLRLLLAEEGYRRRFRGVHPVVPNEPRVPESVEPPGDDRVVYLGRLSRGRGLDMLLALPPLLPAGVRLELVGPADADAEAVLASADRAEQLRWWGFVPNDDALLLLDGALAGLSLLRNLPNYAHSRPTKVVEYMARGIPVVTTPTPIAAEIVEEHACGVVVPFDDLSAVAAAIERLRRNVQERESMGEHGHAAALARYDWTRSGHEFVHALESFAGRSRPATLAGEDPGG